MEPDGLDDDVRRQLLAMSRAMNDCYQHVLQQPYPDDGAGGQLYCNRTWDDIMCWPDGPAGQLIRQPCPDYINNFNAKEFAVRECLSDGTWFVHPVYNRTWTNYSACVGAAAPQHSLIQAHLYWLQPLYRVGYSISVVALFIAIVIMLHFKKLRCPRNTVHINLFVSFILRASVCFLREALVVHGVGLARDIIVDNGTTSFRQDISHWECRLLFTSVYWANVANYCWIFIEGLYLHSLVFFSVFSERSSVKWYMICGWVAPCIVVLPWVIVRITAENVLCWNTHPTPQYFWIIKAPIATTIVINFLFFLNIVRVLYTKLRAKDLPVQARQHRHKRLAKSTLVLIPLFGVPYVIFLIVIDENLSETTQLVKLYLEVIFNSLNGLIVSSVFCFCNEEVQVEVCKRWRRWRAGQRTAALIGHPTFRSVSNVYVSVDGAAPHDDDEASAPRRWSSLPTIDVRAGGTQAAICLVAKNELDVVVDALLPNETTTSNRSVGVAGCDVDHCLTDQQCVRDRVCHSMTSDNYKPPEFFDSDM